MLDFMIKKYEELCLALLNGGYAPLPVYSYLRSGRKSNNKLVILRHDVDEKPFNALKMAELENEYGIQSTYYFRYPRSFLPTYYTFKPGIIEKIHNLGHEVGYHRKICEVKTICMHGSVLSVYDNRDLWNHYDFKEFGIVGEAYRSIKDVSYYSDTGSNWNWKNKMRDFMPDKKEEIVVDTTDDLIKLIKSNKINNFYILAHPGNWSSNNIEWCFNYMTNFVFNIGKKILVRVRQDEKSNDKRIERVKRGNT
jgi:hypothetical protein